MTVSAPPVSNVVRTTSQVRPTRLLLVSVDFLPRVGGVSTMVHNLANALAASGREVTVVAPMGAYVPSGVRADYDLLVDEQAQPKSREGKEALIEEQRVLDMLKGIHQRTELAAILIMHAYYYGLPAVRFARAIDIPVFSVFYGFELRSLLVSGGSWRTRFWDMFLPPMTLKQKVFEVIAGSTRVLSISRYTAALVRQVSKRVPSAVIGCGVADEDYVREVTLTPSFDREAKARLREETGLRRTKTVCFVGRLVESKNVAVIVKAIRRLHECHMVVVGDGPERAALESLASELGVESRITWLGQATEETKWWALRVADVFVLPSKELEGGQVEGFGIVMLEAAISGTPVVAARSGGMVDVIDHEKTGLLFEPDDDLGLAEALNRLLSDDCLSNAYMQALRARVSSQFNWNSVAERVIEAALVPADTKR